MALVDLILSFGRLKRTLRTGWLTKGIYRAQVESVGEHTLRTVFIAMLLADQISCRRKVNVPLTLRMALIHDLPEISLKDMDKEACAYLNLDLETKHRAERKVISALLGGIPAKLQREYLRVWHSYRKGRGLETKIVEVSDKLEAVFQAFEYVEAGQPYRLVSEIWSDAVSRIHEAGLSEAIEILDALETRRQSLC